MIEEWYNLIEYEEYYQINKLGNVKSKTRKVSMGNGFRTVPSKILSNKIHTGGYVYTQLNINGKAKNITVHVYLAKMFILNPNNKPFVNHKDGNKLNNSLDNLEWVTHSENMKHAFDNGLQVSKKGNDHYKSKLTNSQVLEIRRRVKEGETQANLAIEYNVHNVTISAIHLNKRWKHI